MTYSELLHSVSFDEIAPYIGKYGNEEGTALYKTHYDMLKLLKPRDGEDDEKTVTISNAELYYDFEEPHLDAFPIEGCYWEVALAKEIIVEPDVNATWAEIAACCLWHTSFYGFTREQRDETFENLEFYEQNLLDPDITRIRAKRVQKKIEERGGRIPSKKEMMTVPTFRHEVNKRVRRASHLSFGCKKRKLVRRIIADEYWKRILKIGTIICDCLRFEEDDSFLEWEELYKAFFANNYRVYRYLSYPADGQGRGEWLWELITRFNAFNKGILPNIILCINTSHEHPMTASDIDYLAWRSSSWFDYDILWGSWGQNYDDSLGKQLRLSVLCYD